MSDINAQIMPMYIGPKVAIELKTKEMATSVFFKRMTPVPFDATLGRSLIVFYPKAFNEFKETELDRFKREQCADLVPLKPGDVVAGVVDPPIEPLYDPVPIEPLYDPVPIEPLYDPVPIEETPAEETPGGNVPESDGEDLTDEEKMALADFNPEQAEFEIVDGSFQCPLCPKTYKENSGRGKAALLTHLETVHRKLWAQAIISQQVQE